MTAEEKEEFLSDVRYFWQEKGDVRRLSGFSIEKLREADPVIADAFERLELATETFNRLIGEL